MSKFNLNKSVLATAMAAVLIPGMAMAATVAVTGGANKHAYEVTNMTGGNNPTAIANSGVEYTLTAGDILVGRTQASGNVNVRVTLTGGEFAAAPTITVPATQGTVVGSPVISGGVLSFVLQPEDGTPIDPLDPLGVGDGFNAGVLFTLDAGSLSLNKATALATAGGSVVANVDVRDTTSGSTLQAAVPGTILVSTQASAVTLAAATDMTVDVTEGKKEFQAAAAVVDETNVQLGVLTTNSAAVASVSARGADGAGSDFDDNTTVGNLFQFDVATVGNAGVDKLTAQVNFVNATGVSDVYLSSAACTTGAITPSATLVSLTKAGNVFSGSIALASASGEAFNICARVDGTTALAAQAITASAGYDFNTARDIPLGTAATIANWVYNGTSVDVFHVNPGANSNQRSYLRITNQSGTDGNVTITGVCDSGTAGAPASFTLAAGTSVQLTSAQIEDGGAGGIAVGSGIGRPAGCTGKWRLNVTGEFSPMAVQNFLKNYTGSGEVNTNINNAN